jgi:ELWxxDGT repeat protein
MKNSIFILLTMLLTISIVKADDVVLPQGMEKLTPDGVEASGIMSFVNPVSPNSHLPQSGDFYFVGKEEEHGVELWFCGRTKETTRLFLDINPGTESSNPSSLTRVGNKLFFAAFTPEHGKELWVSDGTAAGTRMVKDIYPGITSSNPGSFVILGDHILFKAKDEESEAYPVVDPQTPESWVWISDGTEDGTVRIAEVPVTSYFEVVGNKAFFAGTDLINNMTLWVTDGTIAGTKALKNINNKPTSAGSAFQTESAAIGALRNVNNKWVTFRAETVTEQVGGNYGSEIWWSDGTEEGTQWIGYDFAKGETGGQPTPTEFANPWAIGDTLFFRANDGVHGVEPCIWVLSEPIVEGVNPRQLFDINHWSGSISLPSWPSEFFIYQNYLLLQANGGYYIPEDQTQYASGYSLWLTPMNNLDTCLYQRQFWGTEIYPGSPQDACARFTPVGDKLFFTANDNANNQELWKLDNINTPPVKVVDFPDNGQISNLVNIEEKLYFYSGESKAIYKYNPVTTGINSPKIADNPLQIAIDGQTIRIRSVAKIVETSLYDLSGRLLLSSGNEDLINTGYLKGFYILKVRLENNKQSTHKISIR